MKSELKELWAKHRAEIEELRKRCPREIWQRQSQVFGISDN